MDVLTPFEVCLVRNFKTKNFTDITMPAKLFEAQIMARNAIINP